jgi:predicted phosphoribosyltransferase
MPFRDRAEAGRRLATALAHYRDRRAAILALPRGGLPVAAEIAAALAAPLDLIFVRKIGAPFQPELAMGAVVDGAAPLTVRNDDVIGAAGISDAEFAAMRERELMEIRRRRERYLHGRVPLDAAGRTAIVVDDGVATGATTRAALRAVRQQNPAELVVAVPVGASDTLRALQDEADAIVCLEHHKRFGAIGAYYRDFSQVSDEEVIDILARFPG